jgi:hypothetical protein
MVYVPAPTDCLTAVESGKILTVAPEDPTICPYCGMLYGLDGYCTSWADEERYNAATLSIINGKIALETDNKGVVEDRIDAVALLKANAHPKE